MAYTDIDDSSAFFQTALYTGSGSARNITNDGNSDLQPDWVWIKKRSNGEDHLLFDSVRGINKSLKSNNTSAEQTDGGDLSEFRTDGFRIGTNNRSNQNTHTFVAWQWKAGTSFSNDASSTSVGSIDSTGSVSTDAGFSIISWTSPNDSVATIAHGLGVVPTMIIMKKRGASGGWATYHQAMGNTHCMFLSTTAGKEDNADVFNDTSPTSTVFTTGSDGALVNNTMIAYCFADVQGFSKMGSYIGNGNANGPFAYLGFKPAFLLVKLASGTDDWQILDNKRSPINIVGGYMRPNDDASTTNNDVIDFTSNGFKLRTSAGSWNPDGGEFIYMAFAENPFVTSTGVPATAR